MNFAEITSINKERTALVNVMRRESGARPVQLEDPHFYPPSGSQRTPAGQPGTSSASADVPSN
jgi:hypothetical protein